jgi:protein TonB
VKEDDVLKTEALPIHHNETACRINNDSEQVIVVYEIHHLRHHSSTRNFLKVKTWQCVLLSVAIHGVIFGMPITLKTPDIHTEEIQLLVIASPPMEVPVEKILEPFAAPRSAEPPENLDPPVKQVRREPPAPRKKPVPVTKPVLATSVPKVQPDSDMSSNALVAAKSPEMVEEAQAASTTTESASAGSASSDDSSTHSGGRNSRHKSVGNHGHGVESTVGEMGGPQFIQRSVPRYPRLAQRLGVEGSVLLRLAIDASGKLSRVEVVNGAGNGFDEEAVQAVKRSTFAPAVQAGRPISCLALLKIRFQLSSE